MNKVAPRHADLPRASGFDCPVFDVDLTWAARGIYWYLSTHPYRKKFGMAELFANRRVGFESEQATRRAVELLRLRGYVTIAGNCIEVAPHE